MTLELKIQQAFEAAQMAVSETKASLRNDNFPCGFGWVEVPDGHSLLAKALKANHGGRKHWTKGVYIWNPGNSNWQNVDVAYAGARAFAALFPGEAFAQSRLD